MTEEEADALDTEITNADITLKPWEGSPSNEGVFTRQRKLLDALDRASADYIVTRAIAANKMPLQILGEVVHEKIAASVLN
jgi:hypothetical protein